VPQNKYKLPEDLKTACKAYVRGYKRRVYEYNQKRDDVLNAQKDMSYDMPLSGSSRNNSEPHDKAVRLEEIESHLDTRIMRAIEQAGILIGNDILDESERSRLREAIFDCCKDGRRFVFRYYNLSMDKSTFYRHWNRFLYGIAQNLKDI